METKFSPQDKLTVGDAVLWRGKFGSAKPEVAIVMGIELTSTDKYGDSVDSVAWNEVYGRNVVVSLDNGNWAYGLQIWRLRAKAK